MKHGERKAGQVKMRHRERAREAARELIRAMSRSGRLTSRDEILQGLAAHGFAPTAEAGKPDALVALIKDAVQGHQDLFEVMNRHGVPHYYSSLHMSQSYVALLLRKEGDILDLIAETVRENSALYPRPIPLGTFQLPPFDLSEEETLACITQAAVRPEYQDIGQTTTSAGTVYLYSSRHLEADYAAMLAEWLDVGQFNNP